MSAVIERRGGRANERGKGIGREAIRGRNGMRKREGKCEERISEGTRERKGRREENINYNHPVCAYKTALTTQAAGLSVSSINGWFSEHGHFEVSGCDRGGQMPLPS